MAKEIMIIFFNDHNSGIKTQKSNQVENKGFYLYERIFGTDDQGLLNLSKLH